MYITFSRFDDGYMFELDVTNISDEPVNLSFPIYEQVEFVVDEYEKERWIYSKNRRHQQMPIEVCVESHQTEHYSVEWDGLSNPGEGFYSLYGIWEAKLLLAERIITLMLRAVHLPVIITEEAAVPEYLESTDICRVCTSYKWDDLVPRNHWAYHAMEYIESKREERYFPRDYFNGKTPRTVADFRTGVYPLGDYEIEHSRDDDVNVISYMLYSEMSPTFVVNDAELTTPYCLDQSSCMYSAYDDVPRNHWAYRALNYCTEQGYLEGYPAGFFSSGRTLTRYEFASGILRFRDTWEIAGEEDSGITLDHVGKLLLDALCYEYASQMAEICVFPNRQIY